MLNSTDKMKIKRFVSDVTMFKVVKEVLMERFTAGNDIAGSIEVLGGQRIAQILLNVAFKDLEKYASQKEQDDKPRGQVGL